MYKKRKTLNINNTKNMHLIIIYWHDVYIHVYDDVKAQNPKYLFKKKTLLR